jgi:hypothetical protein
VCAIDYVGCDRRDGATEGTKATDPSGPQAMQWISAYNNVSRHPERVPGLLPGVSALTARRAISRSTFRPDRRLQTFCRPNARSWMARDEVDRHSVRATPAMTQLEVPIAGDPSMVLDHEGARVRMPRSA